jgi:paraquat-inducible protein B
MDVQKTLALSLSVVNLMLFLGSSMYYNQTLSRLSSDIKKLEDLIASVEKQLAGHVSQSVGATNTKVADMKRQMEEAQRSAQALKTQVKTLSQGQTLQMEQLVSVLSHLEGVSDDEKKRLTQTVKQLASSQAAQAPRPALRKYIRFEEEEEEEEVRPAPRRRPIPVAEEEEDDVEDVRPTPRRRVQPTEEEDEDEDVEARLAAVRRRKQRSQQ